jgi:hypothetical protein
MAFLSLISEAVIRWDAATRPALMPERRVPKGGFALAHLAVRAAGAVSRQTRAAQVIAVHVLLTLSRA